MRTTSFLTAYYACITGPLLVDPRVDLVYLAPELLWVEVERGLLWSGAEGVELAVQHPEKGAKRP